MFYPHTITKKSLRALKVFSFIGLSSLGIFLILYFSSNNITFFITPSEISSKFIGKKIRIGGLVKEDVQYIENDVIFTLTDTKSEILVQYSGILPALFRINQGVVAEGFLNEAGTILQSSRILIKHDENYKPPEI